MKKRTRSITIAIVSIFAVVLLAGVLVTLQLTAKFFSPSGLQKVAQQSAVSEGAATMAYDEAVRVDEAPHGMGGAPDIGGIIVPPEPPLPDTAGETAADVEQRIIKNGFLRIVVDNVSETTDRISAYAQEVGGFVQNSSISERADGTHTGSVTVRVPVDRFQEAVNILKGYANTVETEQVTGQDVTEQYTDLEARLRNANAQEETYLELLDQAEDVEDILAIQRELSNVRSTIEYLEGRIQFLKNQTSFATINVNLSEEPRVQAPTKEFRPIASAREAAQALINLGQQLVVGAIWVAIVGGGVLLPLALITWITYRIVQAVKNKNA